MNALPLIIPAACLKAHAVVLGKTGAGKSSTLRHIVEHLLEQDKRVCVIDPKGDWWGLRTSANGKGDGFPVLMFGDFKDKRQDVPMDGRAGKTVGEIVATTKQACVMGFRGWMPSDLTTFWIDFASTLFNHNQGELYLVIDEVHNFAPKGKVLDPQAGKCLHWTNRLASEGRGLNIKLLIASQRPQKVHNDTLTSCETLIAMRVIHEADREAIKAWIDGCGDKEHGKQVLADLAQMKRGEAWVWSPEAGYLERTKFPMFTTFDSFSENAQTTSTRWAYVDIEEVKTKLARVIEEQKENDPKELRLENAKLKAEIHSMENEIGRLEQKLLQEKQAAAPILDPADSEQLCLIRSAIEDARVALADLSAKIDEKAAPAPRPPHEFVPRPTVLHGRYGAPTPTNGEAPADLGKGEAAILTAIAQHRDGADREQLTILTGYKRSTRNAYLQRLQQAGLIEERGEIFAATAKGVTALGDNFTPLPTGAALRQHWLDRLPTGEREIFEVLVKAFPNALDREMISTATDYKRSTRNAYIQRLAARKLIYAQGSSVRASEQLFGR